MTYAQTVKEWRAEFRERLSRLSIDCLSSQWRSATLFPACPDDMDDVISEFKQRGIAMTPVLNDYQRRLVLEQREEKTC